VKLGKEVCWAEAHEGKSWAAVGLLTWDRNGK
jgi:hypothetical protein